MRSETCDDKGWIEDARLLGGTIILECWNRLPQVGDVLHIDGIPVRVLRQVTLEDYMRQHRRMLAMGGHRSFRSKPEFRNHPPRLFEIEACD